MAHVGGTSNNVYKSGFNSKASTFYKASTRFTAHYYYKPCYIFFYSYNAVVRDMTIYARVLTGHKYMYFVISRGIVL